MPDATQDIYVSRQPIFTRENQVWGYRITFTACGEGGCMALDSTGAQEASFVADRFALATRDIGPDKKLCLRMDLHGMVMNNTAHALPPGSLVLAVPEGGDPEQAARACALYRNRNHPVILENYGPDMPGASLLRAQADYVSISFADNSAKEVMAARNTLRGLDCTLVASGLSDWQAVEGAKALGFKLFKGSFFAKPERLKGRKLTSSQSSRMRLLSALHKPGVEVGELSALIATDTALSIRLLRFINSPAFAFRSEVTAIPHAASLLGLKPLKSWATAAVLADMDSSDKGCALYFTAMVRAVFLKLMAENGLAKDMDAETMFLMGLLSNLDALLDMPMEAALGELPLAESIKDAFLRGKGRGADWIGLLAELECGDMPGLRHSMEKLVIPPRKTAARYMEATSVASQAQGAC